MKKAIVAILTMLLFLLPMNVYADTQAAVWAQDTMAASYHLAMAYNKELDVVFLATIDEWDLNDGKLGLYMLDPNKKTIKKVADTAYDENMIDIVFIQ